jgi:hypothetical protein
LTATTKYITLPPKKAHPTDSPTPIPLIVLAILYAIPYGLNASWFEKINSSADVADEWMD